MRLLSVLLLLLCFFVAGIFFGIYMDYSARGEHPAASRHLVYQVQNYPRANMQVNGGDVLTLIPPTGGNPAGLAMNWVGYSPCTSKSTPTNCVIDPNGTPGPYFFTCTSSSGYTCPDPGVQQSPIPPNPTADFQGFVRTDFANLFGIPQPAVAQHPGNVGSGTPATNSITAYVSCSNGTTALNDLNGNPLTSISASKGETVFWISSRPFSLDTSKFPSGLCSNGNPPGGSLTEAQCTIGIAGQTASYSVQSQSPTSCSALAATLITQ